ncbi:MAG: stage V sporulation protein AD [Clostridia bacterium]|nr:stage V sporulation protein AD [Clostridia bacterium]
MNETKRLGGQTVEFLSRPTILGTGVVVGPKEAEGPLGPDFECVENDPMLGQESWEKAESMLFTKAVTECLKKSALSPSDVNFIVAGDLLNQCTASSFGLRALGVPYLGIYGACSTMAEGLSIGAMLVDGGYASRVICAAGSHFCSAEKQYRFPLEYGGQRPPGAQWTVTGCGAAAVGQGGSVKIAYATTGKIEDMGIKDANNMGAAMAPAFVSTVKAHFEDTGRTPNDYDLIISGDLGAVGREIAAELLDKEGYSFGENYKDCGMMIFDSKKQDTHAGGSGCGCSASVLCGHLLPQMEQKKISRLLFVATGALLSPTTTLQGESIPAIAHAVSLEI